MTNLASTIDKLVMDLNAQIARIETQCANELTALRARRDALLKAKAALTPEIEEAVRLLEQVGLAPVRL